MLALLHIFILVLFLSTLTFPISIFPYPESSPFLSVRLLLNGSLLSLIRLSSWVFTYLSPVYEATPFTMVSSLRNVLEPACEFYLARYRLNCPS